MSTKQSTISDDQIIAGQVIYTPRALRLYDLVVLGISNHLIWRCPTSRLLRFYNQHVSDNHLDIGVGSGFYVDRCRFPSASPRIALMDMNSDALQFAASRVARYQPETYKRNVLEPISFDASPFDSIAIQYVLHCLPGSIHTKNLAEKGSDPLEVSRCCWDLGLAGEGQTPFRIGSKAILFDHLRELMNPRGTLFGSTLLRHGVGVSRLGKRLMDFYNRKGIFNNESDSLNDLETALRSRFKQVELETIGCVALFSARSD